MRPRLSSFVLAGIGTLFLAGLATTPGCDSCPDLYYPAFTFDLFGADPSHVFVTVTEQNTGETPCVDSALAERCVPPEGVYELVFVVSGNEIGRVEDVCTLGDLTGCAAEDAEAQGPGPIIHIERDSASGQWTVSLERQGACPLG